MTRNRILILGFVAIGIVLIAAVAAWQLVLKETEQISGPVTSLPEEFSGAPAGATVFLIVPEESQARFTLDEVLRGEPTTVVGTSGLVAGQIAIDPANPTAAQVGVIQINARALATDNQMRNRAIGNRILQTDSYEYITFTPTAISGLPDSVAVGQAFTFQVTGDLSIRDVTRPVTFEVTVTPISETRLEGLASTTVLRSEYDLTIPNVPGVADVSEGVLLELEFVATPDGA